MNIIRNELGVSIIGKAVTRTLYVSLNGTNTNGLTLATAFTSLPAALNAASVDPNDCTLFLISPKSTPYDINTTGDPTWTGNYILKGTHRNWATITNSHVTATSILKFTGKVALIDLTIDCGTGDLNGIIISGSGSSGSRLNKVYFECEDVTGAQTAIEISGGIKYLKLENTMVHGVQAFTRGLLLDNCALSDFRTLDFHDCLTGIQVTNAASDSHKFKNLLFHTCTLGLDLDAGNSHIFEFIDFLNCITNVDDEVGDHIWNFIHNRLPMSLLPDNFVGINLPTNAAADTWGVDTEILAAVGRTRPFRVTGLSAEANATEKFRLRLSADNGATHFIDFQIEGQLNVNKRESIQLPSGTDEIFNYNTRISGSSKSESGADALTIWLEVQEI